MAVEPFSIVQLHVPQPERSADSKAQSPAKEILFLCPVDDSRKPSSLPGKPMGILKQTVPCLIFACDSRRLPTDFPSCSLHSARSGLQEPCPGMPYSRLPAVVLNGGCWNRPPFSKQLGWAKLQAQPRCVLGQRIKARQYVLLIDHPLNIFALPCDSTGLRDCEVLLKDRFCPYK